MFFPPTPQLQNRTVGKNVYHADVSAVNCVAQTIPLNSEASWTVFLTDTPRLRACARAAYPSNSHGTLPTPRLFPALRASSSPAVEAKRPAPQATPNSSN